MADRFLLGATLFPAPDSQQRISSSPASSPAGDKTGRCKVALRPGHSLMDWIRLTNSGKDLSGVGGKPRDVTSEELSAHCHRQDAWIGLKGKVYNVTAYLDYHPGGEEELMRGVGKEATALFNEVHKWVNFESMLDKCLVGRLKVASSFLLKAVVAAKDPELIFAKPRDLSTEVPPSPPENDQKRNGPSTPKYDWYQTDISVSVVIYVKWTLVRPEHVILDVCDRTLRVLVDVQQYGYLMHMELDGEVEHQSKVKISESTGNVEVLLRKRLMEHWAKLGNDLDQHDTFLPHQDRDVHYRWCILQSKTLVTHDTYLLSFCLPEGSRLQVPTGHHVHVKMTVDNMEVIRSYTPICLSLCEDPLQSRADRIHLMVKVYPQGALTQQLNKLTPGSRVSISDPTGKFSWSALEKVDRLAMVAAGTGFTPMVKLIAASLSAKSSDRLISLLFFNKTEKDIFWREQLDELSSDNERFRVQHVLSEADPSWSGSRGRVCKALLESFLATFSCPQDGQNGSREGTLLTVCGPAAFTKATLGYLEELGFSSNEVFAFLG